VRDTTDAAGSGAPLRLTRAIAVSAAVGLVVFSVLFLPELLEGRVFAFRDVANYHLPVSRIVAEEWRAGRVPHWNPWLAAGTPLAANPNNYALYPGRLLDVALGPDVAMQVHLLGHWLAAGIAAGVLVALLGASAPAVAAATLTWLVAGPVLSLLSFANLVPFLLWIPLTAIGLLLLARRPGPGPAAAVAVALAVQSTFAEPGLLVVEVFFATAVLGFDRGRAGRPRRPGAAVVWLGGAVVVAALLSAPAWVPTLRLVAASARAADSAADIATSVPPAALAQLVVPLLTGEYHTLTKSGYWGEVFQGGRGPFFPSIALGTAMIALAAAGLAVSGRRALAPAAAIVAGIVLAMGVHAPGMDALLYSDAGRWFRWPVKLTLLPALVLPLAVAAGVDGLRAGRRRAAIGAAAAGLLLAGVALAFPRWFAASELPSLLSSASVSKNLPRIMDEVFRRCALSAAAGALVAALALAAVRTRGRSRTAVVALLVLVVAAESLPPQRAVNRGTPREILASDPPVLAEARAVAAGGRRVLFPTAHWEVPAALRPGAPDEWAPRVQLDRELGNYYHPLGERVATILVNPDRLVSRAAVARAGAYPRLAPADRRELLRRLAVGGVVRIGLDALASGARLHPTRAGAPVALVPDPSAPMIAGWTAEPPPVVERWSGTVLRALAGGPPLSPPRSAHSPAPGRWMIRSDEPRAGWIVLAETRAAGWTARVDGSPVPVLPYLDDFQAVAVPAGPHAVTLSYRPRGWSLLLLAAFLGLAAASTLAVIAGRTASRFPVSSSAPDRRTRENP